MFQKDAAVVAPLEDPHSSACQSQMDQFSNANASFSHTCWNQLVICEPLCFENGKNFSSMQRSTLSARFGYRTMREDLLLDRHKKLQACWRAPIGWGQ